MLDSTIDFAPERARVVPASVIPFPDLIIFAPIPLGTRIFPKNFPNHSACTSGDAFANLSRASGSIATAFLAFSSVSFEKISEIS